jgi:hypothetical protein
MNDELITTVRESFADVHSATPLEQILARSRTIRAHRRIPRLTAALAVVAGATVLALTALAPASHRAGHQPSAQLAAWTVVKRADGTVSVTIRELRDPAGLQRRLRADGIPASVTFFGHPPRSCRRYPAGGVLMTSVFSGRTVAHHPVMVIHPSALPDGAGVAIRPPAQQPITNVAIDLVYTSPQCTGS